MKYIVILLLSTLTITSSYSQSQNKDLIDNIHKILNDCDYYEVTQEMFELISEDERYQHEEQIAYLKKINYLIYVECEEEKNSFYDDFFKENNLKDFKVLMKTKSGDERFTFYRKKNNDIYEYLLIHDGGLSYIVTSLNISTLNEMSGIMDMVAEMGNG